MTAIQVRAAGADDLLAGGRTRVATVADIATGAEREGVGRIDVTANPHALGFYDAVGFVAGARVETEFGSGLRMHLDVARLLSARR